MHFRVRKNKILFARGAPAQGETIRTSPGTGLANMDTGEIQEAVPGSLTAAETAEIKAYMATATEMLRQQREVEVATLAPRLREMAGYLRLVREEVLSTYRTEIIQAARQMGAALTRSQSEDQDGARKAQQGQIADFDFE